MSAKLLGSLGDEGSHLQRQIGCMTGIFQIFDRQHLLPGRRTAAHHLKRLYPGSMPAEPYGCSPQVGQDKNCSFVENQRASMESSRNSFSSSSRSSSFSSLECNKSMQQEPSINGATTSADMSLKDLPKIQLRRNEKASHMVPSLGTSLNASAKSGRRSTDFRDIVKDSIYRETQGLSIKTTVAEVHREKHQRQLQDSSPQSCKSDEDSYLVMTNRKTPMALDLAESPKIMSKLKEKHRYSSEVKEHPRSSSAVTKDNIFFPVSKDMPRFSYDERDIPRASLDSRESGNSTSRLRDLPSLPRLSLDSRESSMQNLDIGFNTSYTPKDSDRSTLQQKVSRVAAFNRVSREEKQPPGVVAKLMGLEAMPNKIRPSLDQMGIKKDSNFGECSDTHESQKMSTCSLNSSKAASPKSLIKFNIIPQRMISHAKVPIETAPWSHQAKGHVTPKRMPGIPETCVRQRHESVYGEIQRKLKDLEFQPANKDLRALKQILDAIHAKGLLEVKKGVEEHPSELSSKKICDQQMAFDSERVLTSGDAKCSQDVHLIPSTITNAGSMQTWESPIVIMKPVKSLNGSIHSAIDAFQGETRLPKVRTVGATDSQLVSTNDQSEKVQTPKNLLRGNSGHVQVMEKSIDRIDEKASQKARSKTLKVSSRHEKQSSGNGGGLMKSSNLSSPRLQLKKLAMEKKSCSSPSSDSSKQQKSHRQSYESVSPRSKTKPKPRPEKKVADDLFEAKNSRSKGVGVSQKLNKSSCYMSQVDMEPTSSDQSAEPELAPSRDSQATIKVSDVSTSIVRKKKDQHMKDSCSSPEGVASTSDQPSPVSVLDALCDKDETSGSPVKSILFPYEDTGSQSAGDITCNARWSLMGEKGRQTNDTGRKKLRNIENLVQKLKQLGSSDNQEPEANHIASLCETQNPDHHYVSEILLSSGLLLNGLDPPIQLHRSGYPINPDLFLVLEQKKRGSLAMLKPSHQNVPKTKADPERARRRLMFDTVNEILVQKLDLGGAGPLPASWLPAGKLSKRVPSGQLLLKELCVEIGLLEISGTRVGGSQDNEGDSLKSILSQDVAQQSEGWTSSGREVSGLVLDIERLIFKDLIGEVVAGVALMAQRKPYPRRRQLFI